MSNVNKVLEDFGESTSSFFLISDSLYVWLADWRSNVFGICYILEKRILTLS